ncbi:curli-like amyloid fiber formation chaperone CsgH [Burkholderia sp. S171]|uniref:curli-like amyloid fiber formation chaperone CsgH n=1 Tax=Burkholderia sp. S171 TaxID=1641860 RepID=UPI00349EB450
MLPAMELNVWLETSNHQGMTTLIPYVSSAKDIELHYDVRLFTLSPAGRSDVAQGGDLRILAGEPHRLSSLTTRQETRKDSSSRCSLSVSLSRGSTELTTKEFDCSASGALSR